MVSGRFDGRDCTGGELAGGVSLCAKRPKPHYRRAVAYLTDLDWHGRGGVCLSHRRALGAGYCDTEIPQGCTATSGDGADNLGGTVCDSGNGGWRWQPGGADLRAESDVSGIKY